MKVALECDLGDFSDIMLLKNTHFGAADLLTLLPVAVLMLTLFHSTHHCPLIFWY